MRKGENDQCVYSILSRTTCLILGSIPNTNDIYRGENFYLITGYLSTCKIIFSISIGVVRRVLNYQQNIPFFLPNQKVYLHGQQNLYTFGYHYKIWLQLSDSKLNYSFRIILVVYPYVLIWNEETYSLTNELMATPWFWYYSHPISVTVLTHS